MSEEVFSLSAFNRRDDPPGSAARPQPALNGSPDPFLMELASSLLKKAAYFNLFSVHDPQVPNVPLPSPHDSRRLIGMKVYEEMHRFEIDVEQPSLVHGLHAANRVGQSVANIEIDWRIIPDDFVAAPHKLAPPTELNPTLSQRFAMYEGHFRWKDAEHSGFRGFGTGRTFPTQVLGQPQLRIGAVVDILEGSGRFQGLVGNAVVNGFITPPNHLALNILLRIIDPDRRLKAHTAVTTIDPIVDPDPTATFLVFLGEADPDNPITLNVSPDGKVVGATVHELLRLVHLDFDVGNTRSLRSKTHVGALTGALSFTLSLNPQDQRIPLPFYTTNGVFTFFDHERRTVGTVEANVVEGRAFAMEIAGAPPPIIRVIGFGPLRGGTGQFSGVSGMLSINGIISIAARTPSILYVMRLSDPDGKFRRIGC